MPGANHIACIATAMRAILDSYPEGAIEVLMLWRFSQASAGAA